MTIKKQGQTFHKTAIDGEKDADRLKNKLTNDKQKTNNLVLKSKMLRVRYGPTDGQTNGQSELYNQLHCSKMFAVRSCISQYALIYLLFGIIYIF